MDPKDTEAQAPVLDEEPDDISPDDMEEIEALPTPVTPTDEPDEPEEEVELLGDSSEVPNVLRALDEQKLSYRGARKVWDTLTPEQHLLVSGLRRLATTKGTEAAEARKELESARAELAKQKEQLEQERSTLYRMFTEGRLADLAKPPELKPGQRPPDEFTPEGRDFYARRELARHLGPVVGDMRKAAQTELAQREAEAKEAARLSRVAEMARFIEEHPDFRTHKEEIKALIAEKKGALDYKDAYLVVRARHQGREGVLDAAHDAVSGRTPAGGSGEPPMDDPMATYEWYANNPEARRRMLRDMERRG